MRSRSRILDSLEGAYREAFTRAQKEGDSAEMARLDLDFQRDQIQLEVFLDVRDLLFASVEEDSSEESSAPGGIEQARSLLEKARSFRTLTRLR